MDPISKSLVGLYLGSMGILGWAGGSAAVAQGMEAGTLPPSHVSMDMAGVPMSFDLGNITAPSAIVLCVILVLQYLKSRPAGGPTLVIEHRIVETPPGVRLVRE